MLQKYSTKKEENLKSTTFGFLSLYSAFYVQFGLSHLAAKSFLVCEFLIHHRILFNKIHGASFTSLLNPSNKGWA